MCAGMWGLYVDSSRTAVGHVCNVAGILLQGHMPVMWNVCMSVFMVTLFIALSSYEIDILA